MDRVPKPGPEGWLVEPDEPHTYAEIVRPGNVLVGTCTCSRGTYYAELHIRAIKDKVVRGELVVGKSRSGRCPLEGEDSPTAFSIEVPRDCEFGSPDMEPYIGSPYEKGVLTGKLLCGTELTPLGSFKFSLRK